MNNNFREISDPEKMKMALEKITGKKLADYEGIDALVGALMGYYNGELKKKVSKNGDTINGILRINNTSNNGLDLLQSGVLKCQIVPFKNGCGIWVNAINDYAFKLYDDGNAYLASKNLTTNSKEVIGAVNEINSSKVSKNGDTVNGNLEVQGAHYFIGAHNAGFALKNKIGGLAYLGYINTDGIEKGNLIIGSSGYDKLLIGNPYIHSANIRQYLYIRDYYDDDMNKEDTATKARLWFAGGKNPNFADMTLRIDQVKGVKINGQPVLTKGNTRTMIEKLFEGVLNQNAYVTLSKSITDFDMIMMYAGDRLDAYPTYYTPSLLINRQIQIIYGDTDGATTQQGSQSIGIDVEYYYFSGNNQFKFKWGYSSLTGYDSTKKTANCTIYGIKYINVEV